MTILKKFFVVLVLVNAGSAFGLKGDPAPTPLQWVTAWTAGMHQVVSMPWSPSVPEVVRNATVRMFVRVHASGDRVHVVLSNTFGTEPLYVGDAHIAIADHDSKIVPGSDRLLTFSGTNSVSVPKGADVMSDPAELQVATGDELVVSLFLPEGSAGTTFHAFAQHASLIAGPGDLTSEVEFTSPTGNTSWYWLSRIDVSPGNANSEAVVAFGDSITDGAGAHPGDYADWPDQLADRFAASSCKNVVVVNEGIGGNRVLFDGAGVNALARFDHDVLSLNGVRTLIILEGINDIGWPTIRPPKRGSGERGESPFAAQRVTAAELIGGLQQLVVRAHAHGIRVIGGTLLPFYGSAFYTHEGEAVRQQVNTWIRTAGSFDSVIDFDRVVRDPAHPGQFREEFQSGDHLHPSAAGYKAMAESIEMKTVIEGRDCSSSAR